METASILGLLTTLFIVGTAGYATAAYLSPSLKEAAPLPIALLGIFSTLLAFFSFALGAGVLVRAVFAFLARLSS